MTDAGRAGREPPASSQPQTPSLSSPPRCSPWSPQLLSTPSRLVLGTGPKMGQMWGWEGVLHLCSGAQETQTWASPPRAALSQWPAGRAPTLQSCQLSRGAYASPAVPPGAGAFVPSWRGGRQSPQLRAERPSKHQSPSVLPAKFHRPSLLVPHSRVARPAPSGSSAAGRRQSERHPRRCGAGVVL